MQALRLPDFSKPFILKTDACKIGIGAVLMQEQQPIAYIIKGLSQKNQVLSIFKKEPFVIIYTFKKW